MKSPNQIPNNAEDRNVSERKTTWDDLINVPFRGEKGSSEEAKQEILKRLRQIKKSCRGEITADSFMLILFREIQPILSNSALYNLCTSYHYWTDALGEIKPTLGEFWAECDPRVINYFFMVFVAQFLVILVLWKKMDFAPYCISDCAMLAVSFMELDMVQEDMLLDNMKRLGLDTEGIPDLLSV